MKADASTIYDIITEINKTIESYIQIMQLIDRTKFISSVTANSLADVGKSLENIILSTTNRISDMNKADIKVLYECDRRACVNCSPECHYTADITHAKNFVSELDRFVEKTNTTETIKEK